MRKEGKTRFMIETMIQEIEDVEEKRIFIKMYNDKLKQLGIKEVYQAIPFEAV